MILRHPLLTVILSLICSFLLLPISALTSRAPSTVDLICRPFGECEPCPTNELDQPFCMPYGNRRLLHCRKPDQAHGGNNGAGEGGKVGGGGTGSGEIPAWEACGKVIKTERRDFWEFVTCNLLFLIVALTILWTRTSALAAQQYRQLAARISGGWRT